MSAGHYLAAEAGYRLLPSGGNAADAACASGFALQVLEPHMNGPAGEVPILYYCAEEDRTFAISGQGTAPAPRPRSRRCASGSASSFPATASRRPRFRPPSTPGAVLLERFGTRSLEEVLEPARELCGRGFPMDPFLRVVLRFFESRFTDEWPSTGEIYVPLRDVGRASDATRPWRASSTTLVRAERAAPGGREAGLRAARDHFYRGRPAEQIERFVARPLRDASGHENPSAS